MRKHFKHFMVAAGIGAASSVQAETPRRPELYASPLLMKHLEPVKEAILKLSGKNTIVVSRDDIMTRQKISQERIKEHTGYATSDKISEDSLLKMSLVLAPYDSMLPKRFKEPQYAMEELRKETFQMQWHAGNAMALPLRPEEDDKNLSEVCLIVAPDVDETAKEHARKIAGLPHAAASNIQSAADGEDFFQVSVFHEAAHCGQQLMISGDPIRHAFFSLDREIDADRKAFETYQQLHGKNSQKTKKLMDDWHAARAISTVLNSHNLTQQAPSDYHVHSTNLALRRTTGDIDAKIDPSAIILAASSFKEATNLTLGALYGWHSIDITLPNPLLSAGTRIARENPYLQYATARTLRDVMALIHKQDKVAAENPRFALIERTAKEYIEGFERLLPGAATHPVVREHDKVVSQMMQSEAFAKGLIAGNSPKPEETLVSKDSCTAKISPRDGSPESVLRAHEELRFCRMQLPSMLSPKP